MKPFFKELFEYGHYFNQQLAEVFAENPGKTSEKSVKLYSHILNAHHIWNHRIDARQPVFGVWEEHPIHHFKTIDDANHAYTLSILDRLELTDSIDYSNTSGQAFANNVQDILFHVVNHSTYHRGQIAIEFRKCGLEPLMTDYIFYKRSHK